jgi:Predicted acetyltransferase
VNALRAGRNYIPELALVAEENGEPAGHIMLTKIAYSPGKGEEDRKAPGILLLAPLCVRLEERGKGVGTALVREAFSRAKALGYTAVVLVGDNAYYNRFGFRPFAVFGLAYTPESLPTEHVLACELVPGALAGREGVIPII